LIAYLALSPAFVQRSTLCGLLWDAPNDPRGELRWYLSKIRRMLGAVDRQRVEARDDGIHLRLTGCFVDALEVTRAADGDLTSQSLERLQSLEGMFRGDFLEGLEVERSPVFDNWLAAQRRRFRQRHARLLEAIVARLPAAESLVPLERWLALAPFELQAHELLLQALACSQRIREGEEHLAAAIGHFDAEGLECGPLHQAWRKARRVPLQIIPAPTCRSSSHLS
jgi:DNA-binding SARP family transcriptional activator